MLHVTTERDRNVFYPPALCLQRVHYSALWARSGTNRGRQKLWEKTSTLYGLCAIHLNTPATSYLFNLLKLELLMWGISWAPNTASRGQMGFNSALKGLNAGLNPICHLVVLLGAHCNSHVRRIRVKCAVQKITINQIDVYKKVKAYNKSCPVMENTIG